LGEEKESKSPWTVFHGTLVLINASAKDRLTQRSWIRRYECGN
jgi:hypothetical protein